MPDITYLIGSEFRSTLAGTEVVASTARDDLRPCEGVKGQQDLNTGDAPQGGPPPVGQDVRCLGPEGLGDPERCPVGPPHPRWIGRAENLVLVGPSGTGMPSTASSTPRTSAAR